MAVDWLSKLGRAGFEALVKGSVDKTVDEKVEPRFKALEIKLDGIGNRIAGVENRLSGIESSLHLAQDVAQLKVEVAQLKSHS